MHKIGLESKMIEMCGWSLLQTSYKWIEEFSCETQQKPLKKLWNSAKIESQKKSTGVSIYWIFFPLGLTELTYHWILSSQVPWTYLRGYSSHTSNEWCLLCFATKLLFSTSLQGTLQLIDRKKKKNRVLTSRMSKYILWKFPISCWNPPPLSKLRHFSLVIWVG